MKYTFKLLTFMIMACIVLALSAGSGLAFNLFGNACKGSAATSPACQQSANQGSDSNNRLTGAQSIINATANVVALITGLAAVIFIIVGGIGFITSRGNAESVAASRRRIVAAIIGLVIVLLAWTITRFISDNLIK